MNQEIFDLIASAELADLDEFEKAIRKARKDIEKENLKTARVRMAEVARDAGLSVDELIEHIKASPEVKLTGRKKVEPIYQNGDNTDEQWTGRGKQPKWLVQELSNGAKLDDFLIKKD